MKLPRLPDSLCLSCGWNRFLQDPRCYALVLLLGGCILFFPSLASEWAWDDHTLIVGNPRVREWSAATTLDIFQHSYFDVPGYPEGFTEDQYGYYRPLAILVYALLFKAGQGAPWVFHLATLLLHLGCVLWMTVLGREICGSRTMASIAGLLFFLHPVHHQAVFYATGLVDPLAAFLGLGALYGFSRYLSGKSGPWALLLAFAAYALSLLTKEIAILVFLLAGVLAATQGPVRRHRMFCVLCGACLLLGGYLLVRSHFLGLSLKEPGWSHLNFSYLGTAAWVFLRSLVQILVPTSEWYFLNRVPLLSPAWAFVALALTFSLLVFWIWISRRRHGLGICGFWFLAFYLPVSNMLPLEAVGVKVSLYFPEHLLYLPSFGMVLAMVVAYYRVKHTLVTRAFTRKAARLLLAVFWGVLSLQFFFMAWVWQKEERLFWYQTRQDPSSRRAYQGLAYALAKKGQGDLAMDVLSRGLALGPDPLAPEIWLKMLTNMASLQLDHGLLSEARSNSRLILGIWPDNFFAWFIWGAANERLGQLEEAREGYRKTLDLHPGFEQALSRLKTLEEMENAS